MFGVLVPSTASGEASQSVVATANAGAGVEPRQDPNQGYFGSPMSILGAGRVDPFAKFPIEMDLHMHGLVDHSKRPFGAPPTLWRV
jgi:hypothetical protein